MNPPFNGWIAGLPFYGPVLAVAIVLLAIPYTWSRLLGGIVLLAGLAMMLFFRDFPRKITAGPGEVVAPADGTVTAVEQFEDSPHYPGACKRISIFLSVFSVHVNRAPYEGTVSDVRYAPGKYLDARDPESSRVNESNALWMETPAGPMTVRQISGAVARRIVCPVKPGARLQKGEKYGMIRFGSRTELYLPLNAEIVVVPGQKVAGGLSVVARMP